MNWTFDPTFTAGNLLTILTIGTGAIGVAWRFTVRHEMVRQDIKEIKANVQANQSVTEQLREDVQVLAVIQQRVADGNERMARAEERLLYLERRGLQL